MNLPYSDQDEPTELDLVYEDLRKAQARIKDLEAQLALDKPIMGIIDAQRQRIVELDAQLLAYAKEIIELQKRIFALELEKSL